MSDPAISRRRKSGRWQDVQPGVFAVTPRLLSTRGRQIGALLASPPGTVLSHDSAGLIWDICRQRGAIHVTVPRGRPDLRDAAIHRPRRPLQAWEKTRRDGLPVTTVSRTLVDLASFGSLDRVKKAFEEAERTRVLDLNGVRDVLENRRRGTPGIALVRRLLADLESAVMTRSELERAFWKFVRSRGLPEPSTNVEVAGLLVDFYWPEARLVVELDSRSFHGHWTAAERDRERDAKLLRIDVACLRVTDRRLRTDPAGIEADVRARFRHRISSFDKPVS